jgi:MoxR-like ATPase
VLADEINRAPAKVQSALLEAMAERQVSVGRSTYDLSPLFLVMATQNPIEQEGTYPLPEAQLDRFLMHVKIGFPDAAVERRILQQARGEALNGETKPERRVSQQAIFAARKEILGLYMADAVEEYLVQLVMATRTPAKFDPEMAEWIAYGASPRGSIALDRCACPCLAGRARLRQPRRHPGGAVRRAAPPHHLSFEAEAAGSTRTAWSSASSTSSPSLEIHERRADEPGIHIGSAS